jgi:hypothetical protein
VRWPACLASKVECTQQLKAVRVRHYMALALAGVLLRSDRSLDQCLGFIIRLAELSGDYEMEDRIRHPVRKTYPKSTLPPPCAGGRRIVC